jgi:hypothetical protein
MDVPGPMEDFSSRLAFGKPFESTVSLMLQRVLPDATVLHTEDVLVTEDVPHRGRWVAERRLGDLLVTLGPSVEVGVECCYSSGDYTNVSLSRDKLEKFKGELYAFGGKSSPRAQLVRASSVRKYVGEILCNRGWTFGRNGKEYVIVPMFFMTGVFLEPDEEFRLRSLLAEFKPVVG